MRNNLRGGLQTAHDALAVPEIGKTQELLRSRWTYDNAVLGTMQQIRDFETVRQIDEQLFEQIFQAFSGNHDGGLMVRNSREFSTLHHALSCYYEDASKIRDQKSSAVKAGNFAAFFIQPPFLSPGDPDIKYETRIFRSSSEPVLPLIVGASTSRTATSWSRLRVI